VSSRGLTPVVGVVCLIAITVGLAVTVGATASIEPPAEPTIAAFELSADPNGELRVTHLGGDAIDPEELSLHVEVGGEPLDEQPPVPFFSARGFESAPTGAFNSASTTQWRTGQTASLRLAGTNRPAIEAGDTVTVRLAVEGSEIARLEATA
jgi:flagellin-like protein